MIAPKHKNVRERHSCFMSVLLSKYLFEFVGVSYLVCIYLFSAKQVDEKNVILYTLVLLSSVWITRYCKIHSSVCISQLFFFFLSFYSLPLSRWCSFFGWVSSSDGSSMEPEKLSGMRFLNSTCCICSLHIYSYYNIGTQVFSFVNFAHGVHLRGVWQ